MSVKICGLKTPETVEAALNGGADHIGFIFFDKSPRNTSHENAATLRRKARGRAAAVAVTVDADDETLDAIVEAVDPDMLQLHGHESPQRVGAVRKRYGRPVMKAIALRDTSDVATIDAYRGVADRFLFEAKPPAGSDRPGGNGVAFDWTLLAGLDPDIDYMLSGGLGADNVIAALQSTGARAIDLSSGVERSPGVKDPALIDAFFKTLAAKAA